MEKEVKHIAEYLEKGILESGYELGTRFGQGTLLVYICNLEEEREMTIEKYFEISKKRCIKIEDFNI